MDLVLHSCYSVQVFVSSRRGRFEVEIEVDCSRVKVMQVAIGCVFMSGGSGSVLGKLSKG